MPRERPVPDNVAAGLPGNALGPLGAFVLCWPDRQVAWGTPPSTQMPLGRGIRPSVRERGTSGRASRGTRRYVSWLPRLRPANTKRQQNTTPHNKQVRIESVVLFNETPECYDFPFEYIHLIPVKHGSTPSRPIALRLQNVIIDIGLLNNVVQ